MKYVSYYHSNIVAELLLQIFTGYPPFSGAPEHAVQRSVCGPENARPRRPEDLHLVVQGLSDMMWSIVVCCWDRDPGVRMSAKQLSRQLEELADDFQNGVTSSGRVVLPPPPPYSEPKAAPMLGSFDPPTYSAPPVRTRRLVKRPASTENRNYDAHHSKPVIAFVGEYFTSCTLHWS